MASITVNSWLMEAQNVGLQVQSEGADLVIKGPNNEQSAYWAEVLLSNKPEVMAELTNRCPACEIELRVAYEEGHRIRYCPLDKLDFYLVELDARQKGKCLDCGEGDLLDAGLCFRCGQLQLFLSSPPICGHTNVRWRFRDGFYWHCATCDREKAPKDAIWHFAGKGAEVMAQNSNA